MKKYKILGGMLIAAGAVLIIFVLYHNSQKRQQALVFSPRLMLNLLWTNYKRRYWDSSTGRTIDRQRGNITTSEGQSYTMLRAVWEDDKPTFDQTWQWTLKNLKRPDSNLFSWLYGRQASGNYAILTDQGGQNTATDADEDIALALIFASSRWNDPAYTAQAKLIIADIWANEVVAVNGKPYITADNLEKNSPSAVMVNPSYFAPYAYRIFAALDPTDNWIGAVTTSYDILNRGSTATLDKTASAGLPSDWLLINKTDGSLSATGNAALDPNFGYDAIRTPFRIALDYRWYGDVRAKAYLDRLSFLGQQWQENGRWGSVYAHDGTLISADEAPAAYGATIGYFLVSRPDLAESIYKNKLLTLYSADAQDWKQVLSYYDDNWSWFGLALYNNVLVNLYAKQ